MLPWLLLLPLPPSTLPCPHSCGLQLLILICPFPHSALLRRSCVLDLLQSLYAVGYGSVVDSGTTFTYIPSAAFQGLVQMVDKAAKAKGLQRTPGSDPQVCHGRCITC